MIKFKRKLSVVLAVGILLSGALATNIFAANFNKMLDARYRDIKILHNGQKINIEPAYEPFIVHIDGNPTTFVPVRALGEILDKNVIWNQEDYSVNIQDKPNIHVVSLTQELVLKNEEIKGLKEELAMLKAELEKTKVASTDKINELEKYLNRQYGYYEKVNFYIEVRAPKKDIDVNIIVDLDKDYSRWSALSDSQIKSYIDDIVKEIKYDFKDNYISGYIEDKRSGKLLVDFYTNSNGKPVVSFGSGYTGDLGSLEHYLNNRFVSDYSWAKLDFEIELVKSGNKITMYLDIRDSDWEELRDTYKKTFLEDINYEISRDFRDTIVEGYIYYYNNSSSYQDRFKFDKDGKVDIW